MTTFQSVVYALIHSITGFLPIGTGAHHLLFPLLIEWQGPPPALLAAMYMGTLWSLLIYFRHDWASMISCFLQVILFRKRPMTLDERLPLFLGVSLLPVLVAGSYMHSTISELSWSPLTSALVFAAFGLPLWFFDYSGRKIKGMFDWKWLDAGVVGFAAAFSALPIWDPLTAAYFGALFMNYRREPAAKYAYYLLTPLWAIQAFTWMKDVNFHAPAPSADLSWLSFGAAFLVSILVGLLVIGGFMKHIQQKGVGQYVVYRWIFAFGFCIVFWLRSQ